MHDCRILASKSGRQTLGELGRGAEKQGRGERGRGGAHRSICRRLPDGEVGEGKIGGRAGLQEEHRPPLRGPPLQGAPPMRGPPL
jgi:hypothetical protein